MKKLEYLSKALTNGLADDLAWIISAFCSIKEEAQSYTQNPYEHRLVNVYSKYRFVNQKGELEEIEDADTSEPLFRFKDKVDIDGSWGANIKSKITTSIGNVIFNNVAILPNFGEKFDFEAGKLNISSIEKNIAARLEDTPTTQKPRDPTKIYVDEYLKFRDALVYLEQFASITSWSATKKGITKPTGIDAYRKQLLEEYGDKLKDRAFFAEYEAKLKAFDKEYLKDDPAYGTFMKGKVLDISRKKMFLAIGIPESLDGKDPVVPITRTLEEGQPTDPVEYTASLNGARFGSFSRGSETINGGVVSKRLIAVGSNFRIDLDDCETLFGMRKTYGKENINLLVGRTIIVQGKPIKLEKIDDARHYLDTPVIVRSPAYCKAGIGDRLCKVCSGEAISRHPDGLIIPLTEVSSIILTQSLKAMHGKVLSTAEVDLTSAFS